MLKFTEVKVWYYIHGFYRKWNSVNRMHMESWEASNSLTPRLIPVNANWWSLPFPVIPLACQSVSSVQLATIAWGPPHPMQTRCVHQATTVPTAHGMVTSTHVPKEHTTPWREWMTSTIVWPAPLESTARVSGYCVMRRVLRECVLCNEGSTARVSVYCVTRGVLR